MKYICKTLLVLFSFTTFAFVNMGTFVPNAFKAQSDTTGGRTAFAFNPFVSVDVVMPTFWGHYFNPELGFVLHTDAEDETSHNTIFIHYAFEMPLSGMALFRYGMSTFMSRVGGGGETIRLNNGSGYQDFYAPNETVTSYTSSLDVGFKAFFGSNWGVRLDGHVMRFLSSEKRSLAYTFSVVYK
jgi:hypothetical protein